MELPAAFGLVALGAIVGALAAFRAFRGMRSSVDSLSKRVDLLENRVVALPRSPERTSALTGLRVSLVVAQDHPQAPFTELLRRQLFLVDASDVDVYPDGRAARAAPFDLLIEGSVTCNGYAEVYYDASFTCSTVNEAICSVIERPPGGDRPANLAMELVAKLDEKLADLTTRSERRRALRELGGL